MRRSDNVALELITQNQGVAALNPAGHRLPYKGKCLMAIETAQLDDLTVQRKSLVGKSRFAEAKTAGIFIDDLALLKQPHTHRIKLRVLQVPEANLPEIAQRNSLQRQLLLRRRLCGDFLRGFANHAIAIE